MGKYEILDHPTDLKIRTFGRTKKELFLNMLAAMSESQKAEAEKGEVKKSIKVNSIALPVLLADFLNEALYFRQTRSEVYFNFEFKKLTDTEIEGELIGKKAKRFGEDIKAATYHGLDVRQKKDGSWKAVVLLDV